MELRVGKKYRLGKKIGSGSFGGGARRVMCAVDQCAFGLGPLLAAARSAWPATRICGVIVCLRLPLGALLSRPLVCCGWRMADRVFLFDVAALV